MKNPMQEEMLSILIPVYNERAFLRKCVTRVLEAPLPMGLRREIILVDDCSTDGTRDIIAELANAHPESLRVFYQSVNQGKGAAIRRAIQEMQGEYAIFQDADMEYDPNDYPALLNPILLGYADVVYGSRFATNTMRRILNFHHEIGNKLLTNASNFFTGLNLSDMETCYKVFKADILKTIPLRSNRFGMEPEITAKIAKRDCVVYEVPIAYHGRSYAEGKKIGWKDGISALYTIVKYWLIDDCYGDNFGHHVLANIAKARKFNQWMADVITPFLGQRIIEVGSGIGNMSRLLPKKELLTVTDIEPSYLEILNRNYEHNENVSVERLNLDEDTDFEKLCGQYDTVVCLNVLEHIEDDHAALVRMRRLLSPKGRLVLLVPQYSSLYGTFDKKLSHYRRYDKLELAQLLQRAGYKVHEQMNFNILAILGWYLNTVFFKREKFSLFQLKAYDMTVPFMRHIEPLVPFRPGMSLIMVAENAD